MQGTTVACDFAHCTREELLPSSCKHCKKRFCVGHASQADHKCPFLNVPGLRTTVCPVCASVIRVEEGESLDHAINVHIDTGRCTLRGASNVGASGGRMTLQEIRQQQEQRQKTLTTNNAILCSLPACNEIEALPVVCGYCNQKFCLKHKMPEHHNCAKLSSVKTGGQVLGGNAASRPATAVSAPFAAAVAGAASGNNRLIQASNTAATANGIRPGRSISMGDITVLVVYDADRLVVAKPNLKPIFFSVAPITPLGRLIDAAVDSYPSLSKTARYTLYSSVPHHETGRHLLENQNATLGDIYGMAAALGGSWPPVAEGKANILGLCISVEPSSALYMPASFCPYLTAEQRSLIQQQQQQQGQKSGGTSAAGSKAVSGHPPAAVSAATKEMAVQHEKSMRDLRPYVDATGQVVHILVDRAAAVCWSNGGANGDKQKKKKKKDDSCSCQ